MNWTNFKLWIYVLLEVLLFVLVKREVKLMLVDWLLC